MIEISVDLVNKIRGCIHEPYISNRLRLLELEKWLRTTAALDTIEDVSSAINYYVNSTLVLELGGLYLHIYGLLQALYVSQDCVVSLRKSLLNKEIHFKDESPGFYDVRNIRDDILHATDRGKVNKSYIYLKQWSLSKPYFEYHKQTPENMNLKSTNVNVTDLIEKNNKEVNRYLEEIKSELERKLKMEKEKYANKKLVDIFNNLNYAAEKLSENSPMAQCGYESMKTMLQKYKEALDERYVSWKECVSDAYEIEFINDIYDILDRDVLSKSSMPGYRIESIKKILIDDLLYHFQNLAELAKEHDNYCEEKSEDEGNDNELIVNVAY